MTSTRTRTTRVTTAAGAALALVLLSGCGGGGGTSADSASGGAASRVVGQDPQAAGDGSATAEKAPAGDAPGGTSGTGSRSDAAAPVVTDQRVVRDAAMTVRAKDVAAAGAQVRTAAETAKGFVSDEKTSTTPSGQPGDVGAARSRGWTESVLTLRVPSSGLDRVMTQVGRTGEVLDRSQSSEDVTSTYVDVRSRVASQTASVERVRALLARAGTLGQIVQIEGELSRREADLESLQAQLKSLEDRTELS